MKRFLAAVFAIRSEHLARGDSRVVYWREKRMKKWNWHCAAANGEIVCASNQGYDSEAALFDGVNAARDALSGAKLVKKVLT